MGNHSGKLSSDELARMQQESQFSERDLKRLYRRFKRLDKDGSGTIDMDEFLAIQSIAVNPLVYRIISIFDLDGDREIDFKEFISAMATISGVGDRTAKLKMAFQVYDMDADGYISNGELFQVLRMMVGSNLNDVQLQQIVDKTIIAADEDGDGKISFQEFLKMVEHTNVEGKMTIQF
eukprot:TRINITY_DN14755_c0_g1_i1.p1 TRINITY_DN14755_c0_g1~~TRINITY_DN14755_c0_g1_i1.p1  ORF type:complete len:178 (-),score=37.32 TRINITY_DN14755_c0_g1_i1:91-624(-)